MRQVSRRSFIAGLAATARLSAADSWAQVPAILRRINAPAFPGRTFDLTRYGARDDGKTDCTAAFKRAIDECSQAGGGRVTLPPGDFLSGPIHLKSNVELHLPAGSTIRFIRDPKRYLPLVYTRWEGMECMNYS